MPSLVLKTRLSRQYIAPDRSATLYLLVDITAAAPADTQPRLPLNIGFVIDRSGSMSGDKLDFTKQAVQYAIDHFTPQDIASLTVFDNAVEVLCKAGPVTLKDEFKGQVRRIFPGGSTNLSGGLLKGYREVAKNRQSEQVNRVLLLTDGLANVGIQDPEQLCAKAAGMKRSGVAVTTLGVGNDFDEDLLTALAETSGGNYYFIDATDNIPRIFAQELQSLLAVAAQNVRLNFECSAGVEVTRVWNYRPSGEQPLEIELPDLFCADHKIVLLELAVTAPVVGTVTLGRATLAYEDAGFALKHVAIGIDLSVSVTRDRSLLALPDEPEVMVQVELCRTLQAREEAIRLADEGNQAEAKELLQSRIAKLADHLTAAPAILREDIQQEIDSLQESAEVLHNQNYSAETRKKMAFRNYQRRNTRN